MCSASPLVSNPHGALLSRAPTITTATAAQFRLPVLHPDPRRSLTAAIAAARSPDVPIPSDGGEGTPRSFDFLRLKRELDGEDEDEEDVGEVGGLGDGEREEVLELPRPSGPGAVGFSDGEEEEEEEGDRGRVVRSTRRRMSASGRQMVRRSTLLAKQVISMRSACSVGFVSQIWVDTGAWLVVILEVRPSILAGENEKFLLEDISQVGDVVLIEDETVAEYDINMVGLDTLVGYNVVTVDRYNVGKVRDFNFNINSGAVESLELDPFGMSIIPASLVSTYSLLVEDILEIKSDRIVVHDGAVSRMQRLSKGFWDTESSRYTASEIDEYSFQRQGGSVRDAESHRRILRRRKFHPRSRESDNEWELPMEY